MKPSSEPPTATRFQLAYSRDGRPVPPERLTPSSRLRVCPECAGPLARASACVTCLACGWGRCD